MTLYTSHNNTLLIHPHSLCQAHIQSQIVQPSHQNLLISKKISMVTFSSTCFLVYQSLSLSMLHKAVVWAFSHWYCLGQPNQILVQLVWASVNVAVTLRCTPKRPHQNYKSLLMLLACLSLFS